MHSTGAWRLIERRCRELRPSSNAIGLTPTFWGATRYESDAMAAESPPSRRVSATLTSLPCGSAPGSFDVTVQDGFRSRLRIRRWTPKQLATWFRAEAAAWKLCQSTAWGAGAKPPRVRGVEPEGLGRSSVNRPGSAVPTTARQRWAAVSLCSMWSGRCDADLCR